MTREDRTKGFFVAFDYTSDALREIDRFFRQSAKASIALTVREILDEAIARKLGLSGVAAVSVQLTRPVSAGTCCGPPPGGPRTRDHALHDALDTRASRSLLGQQARTLPESAIGHPAVYLRDAD